MFAALLNVGVSQMFLLWFENYAAKTPPGLKPVFFGAFGKTSEVFKTSEVWCNLIALISE